MAKKPNILFWEIFKDVYLGNKEASQCATLLKKHNITHVCNCTDEIPNYFEKPGSIQIPFYSEEEEKEFFLQNPEFISTTNYKMFNVIDFNPPEILKNSLPNSLAQTPNGNKTKNPKKESQKNAASCETAPTAKSLQIAEKTSSKEKKNAESNVKKHKEPSKKRKRDEKEEEDQDYIEVNAKSNSEEAKSKKKTETNAPKKRICRRFEEKSHENPTNSSTSEINPLFLVTPSDPSSNSDTMKFIPSKIPSPRRVQTPILEIPRRPKNIKFNLVQNKITSFFVSKPPPVPTNTPSSKKSQSQTPNSKSQKKSSISLSSIQPLGLISDEFVEANDDVCKICKTRRGKIDQTEMIFCEFCERWYHYSCVGITHEEAIAINNYKCPLCKKETKKTKKTSMEVKQKEVTSDGEEKKSKNKRSKMLKKQKEAETEEEEGQRKKKKNKKTKKQKEVVSEEEDEESEKSEESEEEKMEIEETEDEKQKKTKKGTKKKRKLIRKVTRGSKSNSNKKNVSDGMSPNLGRIIVRLSESIHNGKIHVEISDSHKLDQKEFEDLSGNSLESPSDNDAKSNMEIEYESLDLVPEDCKEAMIPEDCKEAIIPEQEKMETERVTEQKTVESQEPPTIEEEKKLGFVVKSDQIEEKQDETNIDVVMNEKPREFFETCEETTPGQQTIKENVPNSEKSIEITPSSTIEIEVHHQDKQHDTKDNDKTQEDVKNSEKSKKKDDEKNSQKIRKEVPSKKGKHKSKAKISDDIYSDEETPTERPFGRKKDKKDSSKQDKPANRTLEAFLVPKPTPAKKKPPPEDGGLCDYKLKAEEYDLIGKKCLRSRKVVPFIKPDEEPQKKQLTTPGTSNPAAASPSSTTPRKKIRRIFHHKNDSQTPQNSTDRQKNEMNSPKPSINENNQITDSAELNESHSTIQIEEKQIKNSTFDFDLVGPIESFKFDSNKGNKEKDEEATESKKETSEIQEQLPETEEIEKKRGVPEDSHQEKQESEKIPSDFSGVHDFFQKNSSASFEEDNDLGIDTGGLDTLVLSSSSTQQSPKNTLIGDEPVLSELSQSNPKFEKERQGKAAIVSEKENAYTILGFDSCIPSVEAPIAHDISEDMDENFLQKIEKGETSDISSEKVEENGPKTEELNNEPKNESSEIKTQSNDTKKQAIQDEINVNVTKEMKGNEATPMEIEIDKNLESSESKTQNIGTRKEVIQDENNENLTKEMKIKENEATPMEIEIHENLESSENKIQTNDTLKEVIRNEINVIVTKELKIKETTTTPMEIEIDKNSVSSENKTQTNDTLKEVIQNEINVIAAKEMKNKENEAIPMDIDESEANGIAIRENNCFSFQQSTKNEAINHKKDNGEQGLVSSATASHQTFQKTEFDEIVLENQNFAKNAPFPSSIRLIEENIEKYKELNNSLEQSFQNSCIAATEKGISIEISSFIPNPRSQTLNETELELNQSQPNKQKNDCDTDLPLATLCDQQQGAVLPLQQEEMLNKSAASTKSLSTQTAATSKPAKIRPFAPVRVLSFDISFIYKKIPVQDSADYAEMVFSNFDNVCDFVQSALDYEYELPLPKKKEEGEICISNEEEREEYIKKWNSSDFNRWQLDEHVRFSKEKEGKTSQSQVDDGDVEEPISSPNMEISANQPTPPLISKETEQEIVYKRKGACLIHCQQAHCRSVTFMYAFGVKKLGKRLAFTKGLLDRITNHYVNNNYPNQETFKHKLIKFQASCMPETRYDPNPWLQKRVSKRTLFNHDGTGIDKNAPNGLYENEGQEDSEIVALKSKAKKPKRVSKKKQKSAKVRLPTKKRIIKNISRPSLPTSSAVAPTNISNEKEKDEQIILIDDSPVKTPKNPPQNALFEKKEEKDDDEILNGITKGETFNLDDASDSEEGDLPDDESDGEFVDDGRDEEEEKEEEKLMEKNKNEETGPRITIPLPGFLNKKDVSSSSAPKKQQSLYDFFPTKNPGMPNAKADSNPPNSKKKAMDAKNKSRTISDDSQSNSNESSNHSSQKAFFSSKASNKNQNAPNILNFLNFQKVNQNLQISLPKSQATKEAIDIPDLTADVTEMLIPESNNNKTSSETQNKVASASQSPIQSTTSSPRSNSNSSFSSHPNSNSSFASHPSSNSSFASHPNFEKKSQNIEDEQGDKLIADFMDKAKQCSPKLNGESKMAYVLSKGTSSFASSSNSPSAKASPSLTISNSPNDVGTPNENSNTQSPIQSTTSSPRSNSNSFFARLNDEKKSQSIEEQTEKMVANFMGKAKQYSPKLNGESKMAFVLNRGTSSYSPSPKSSPSLNVSNSPNDVGTPNENSNSNSLPEFANSNEMSKKYGSRTLLNPPSNDPNQILGQTHNPINFLSQNHNSGGIQESTKFLTKKRMLLDPRIHAEINPIQRNLSLSVSSTQTEPQQTPRHAFIPIPSLENPIPAFSQESPKHPFEEDLFFTQRLKPKAAIPHIFEMSQFQNDQFGPSPSPEAFHSTSFIPQVLQAKMQQLHQQLQLQRAASNSPRSQQVRQQYTNPPQIQQRQDPAPAKQQSQISNQQIPNLSQLYPLKNQIQIQRRNSPVFPSSPVPQSILAPAVLDVQRPVTVVPSKKQKLVKLLRGPASQVPNDGNGYSQSSGSNNTNFNNHHNTPSSFVDNGGYNPPSSTQVFPRNNNNHKDDENNSNGQKNLHQPGSNSNPNPNPF